MKNYKRDLRKLLKLYDLGELTEEEYFRWRAEIEQIWSDENENSI